jgi:hypothetical protein
MTTWCARFSLDVDGNLKVDLRLESFNLDFGFNQDKKFYFDTSEADEIKSI